jgi:hypothetical protein
VFHIRDGNVRHVDSRTAIALIDICQDGWKDIKPVNTWLGPFSLIGKSVGFMGRTTNSLAAYSRKITSHVSYVSTCLSLLWHSLCFVDANK